MTFPLDGQIMNFLELSQHVLSFFNLTLVFEHLFIYINESRAIFCWTVLPDLFGVHWMHSSQTIKKILKSLFDGFSNAHLLCFLGFGCILDLLKPALALTLEKLTKM